jgi:hypothetical protein
MGDTYVRDINRVKRWFKHTGDMPYVPAEAFDLLNRRLAARARSLLICSPLLAAAVALYMPVLFTFGGADTDRWGRTFAARALPAFALLTIAFLLANRITVRAERRIGQELPSRATRATAVSLRTMLGRYRTLTLLITITVEVALMAPLLTLQTAWFAWAYVTAFAAAVALSAFGVKQAATRPTLAMDPVSLAIDERLRSNDAYQATAPLTLLITAFPAVNIQHGPGWLILVWGASGSVILLLRAFGTQNHPWQTESSNRLRPTLPHPGGI